MELAEGVVLLGRLPKPLCRLFLVLRHSPAGAVTFAQVGLSSGLSSFGRLAYLLDGGLFLVRVLCASGMESGQGNEEKYQLPSVGVSVGHDSYQTPPKSLILAGQARVSRSPAYLKLRKPSQPRFSTQRPQASPLWSMRNFGPDPRKKQACFCPVPHLLEVRRPVAPRISRPPGTYRKYDHIVTDSVIGNRNGNR